ncbi:MAG: hypothetical protein L7F78_12835 [Syntrophales bacterium LBB04]|nr:hypothetical protein [Syntrophales bacterium LBB04]
MLKKRASVFRKKNLPQAIEFLDEAGMFTNNEAVYIRRRFSDKIFLKEVHDIADETLHNYHYCDDDINRHSGFNITLGGSLDILSPAAGCASPECKRNEALNIARTVGLLANKVFVTDHLSALLSCYSNNLVDAGRVRMMTAVLKTLAPFIDNNTIELRTPVVHFCQNCQNNIDAQIMLFLDSVIDCEAEFELRYLGQQKQDHLIVINSPELARLCEAPAALVQISKKEYSSFSFKPNNKQICGRIKDEPFVLSKIREHHLRRLRNVIQGTRSADRTSSLFMAKSKLDTLFLSSLDGVRIQRNGIEQWESMRSIDLPWIGQLTMNQVIRLKEEASVSLESLRDHITGIYARRAKASN